MEEKSGISVWKVMYPLGLAIVMAGGFYLGINSGTSKQLTNGPVVRQRGGEALKLNEVLNAVQQRYVDTINQKDLVENSIAELLHNLDPHSSYIPAKLLTQADEPLRGSFGGVGIRFMILRDSLTVTNVIENAPCERAGIKPGDRIIAINDTSIVGNDLKNELVFGKLKGLAGTNVALEVYRKSTGEKRVYRITRGDVPIKSVESVQMISDNIGYIKVVRFAETTPREFRLASKKLQNKGATKLILDLRDNGGGFLHAAVAMADEFLPLGDMIVYTDGKFNGRTDYLDRESGLLEKMDLAVLINSNSASASEIVAGAIQDNDRGVIIGRRSFGKGLVQETIPLEDGSVMRLTVSRYYTPSGRCIQRPYGDGIDYNDDIATRYENGEFYHEDTVQFENLEKFTTKKGKTVYGGGGIHPDIFVPVDTSGASRYLTNLSYSAAFSHFSFDYVEKHRREILKMATPAKFNAEFIVTDNLLDEFVQYAGENHEIKLDMAEFKKSKQRISTRLKAQIAQNIWEENGWFTVFSKDDKEVKEALKALN